MAGKGFRLEQILNLRRELEKVRRQEFAAARREYETAHDRLKRDETALDLLMGECRERQLEGMPAEELRLYADFSRRRQHEIRMQREAVSQLNRKMAEQREILMEANKEKKALETLRDKHLKAERQGRVVKEQGFLDELSSQKWGGGK